LSLALNLSLAIGHLLPASGPGSETRGADAGQCFLDRMPLDARQRQKLSVLRQTMRGKRAAFWQRATTLKSQLAESICSEKPERSQVVRLVDEFAQNQADMQRTVVDHLLSVSAILSPEQRKQFRTRLRSKMFQGLGHRPSNPVGQP